MPFRQGTISLNSFDLCLLYFDPCHNLSGSSSFFVFTCCTFVVLFCLLFFLMKISIIDVIYVKFVNPANAPRGNFACLYIGLQHLPQGYHEPH